ncbi:MAG: amino acid racemase [Planctomycetes bacterium]|nr:amino acid racemase [Planctomycetota bacterium]
MARTERVVGVLGGMGPAAALEFCRRLLIRTPGVAKDQDHLRVVLDNNAKIPDRTAARLGRGPSPVPAASRSLRALRQAGADFVVIPCNTIHIWYPQLRRAAGVPLVHLVECTIAEARRRVRGKPRCLGVMATDGTMKAGLYHATLEAQGIEAVSPSPAEQRALMRGIHDIKAGRREREARRAMRAMGQRLVKRGAQAVLLGCTEISLALSDGDLSVPVVDSLDALVAETLRRARPTSGTKRRRKRRKRP